MFFVLIDNRPIVRRW